MVALLIMTLPAVTLLVVTLLVVTLVVVTLVVVTLVVVSLLVVTLLLVCIRGVTLTRVGGVEAFLDRNLGIVRQGVHDLADALLPTPDGFAHRSSGSGLHLRHDAFDVVDAAGAAAEMTDGMHLPPS